MTNTPVIKTDLTRRRLLAAALVTGVGAAVPISAARQTWAAPTAPGPSQLTLPRPTGPHPVGTVPLHLVDTSRPDPVAGPGHHRELMAGVWYPACKTKDLPRAPWMTQGALRALLADVGFPLDPALGPLTAAHVDAPVHQTGHRLPVVVYSHGAGSHRSDHTIMVQELASHGYAVVTVDHTYDAFSEFPDGRLTVPAEVPPFLGPRDFATDLRFVLDVVEGLAAGHNPDVDGRPLPQGLLGALDPRCIGAFGWSKGGTATALTMLADQRVGAGLSIDGPMQPTIATDLDRPFMMLTASFTRAAMPDVAEFWTHLRGWRLNIQADGAIHKSYGDDATLIPQAAGRSSPSAATAVLHADGRLPHARPVRPAGEGGRLQQLLPGHGRPGDDGRRPAAARHDLPAHRLCRHRHGGRGARYPDGEARRGARRPARGFTHEGPALVDVVTDPAAPAVPPKITTEQISGFALSASRTVLSGGVGSMVHLARANLRTIPRA